MADVTRCLTQNDRALPGYRRDRFRFAAPPAKCLQIDTFSDTTEHLLEREGLEDAGLGRRLENGLTTAIINPLFLVTFFGALVFTCLAASLHLGADERSRLPWIAAAFVLYLAVVVVTLRINVPLNNDIEAAGDPDSMQDLGDVRGRFNETKWVRWNTFRAVATIAAFSCLAWALVLHGRATPPSGP